jgi:hypothetical protein
VERKKVFLTGEFGPAGLGIILVLALCLPQSASYGQELQDAKKPEMSELLGRIDSLESELSSLREQMAAEETDPPDADSSGSEGAASNQSTEQSGQCQSGCRCGRFLSCQCPLEEAPCIDCPRVSTLSPNFNVNIFGTLTLDMLFSGPRSVAVGTPFFLIPDSVAGFDQDTVSIHARQSTIGAAFTGPKFGGWQSGGLAIAMFYNDAVVVDEYGFLPVQAYGELRNEQWRFAAGMQFDVFNPALPTVLPFSALSASGNSGNSFRGQIRLERFLNPSENVQWTLQGALSDPIAVTIDPAFRVSEDNGWPNLEARIAFGIGAPELVGLEQKRPFEIGVSGVGGQLRTTEPLVTQVVANVWGVGTDFRWKMAPKFGIAGEFYTGQGLGTYGGAVLQNINIDSVALANSTLNSIRSTGGWLEAFYYLTPCLHSHTGYGIDDPIDRDVSQTQLTENSTIFANLLWDVNPTFRVAFEYTYRETKYRSPLLLDNEGSGFHTQFQWSF